MAPFKLFLYAVLSLVLVACGNPYEEGRAALAKLDYDTALIKFKKASNDGNVEATLQVANMYKKGQGGGVNLEEAVRWYKLAADKGSAEAMFNLGKIFKQGFFPNNAGRMIKSEEESSRWYMLAANNGHVQSQYLSVLNLDVSKDQSLMLEWLKNSAVGGISQVKDDGSLDEDAFYDPTDAIGLFYYNNKDYSKAYKWAIIYQSKFKVGDRKAVSDFAPLKEKIEQSANLTVAELNQAAELAKLCLANKLKNCD